MIRKSFVKVVLNPPYFSDECATVGTRKLWIQLNTGRGQNRTIGDLATLIQEKFQITQDIRLADQNGYLLEDELDFAVVDDIKFGHSSVFVWPALKHIDDPTVITEAISAVTPLPPHNDPGTPASAEQTTNKRNYQTIRHGSSNDGDLDSGMSDGGDDEEDKFTDESCKIASVGATANEDDTGNQPGNKAKPDVAKAAIASPLLMEALTQQDSGLVITQQEFAAAPNWKIPERPMDRRKLAANRNRPIKKLVFLIPPLSSSATVPEKASEIRETSTVSFGPLDVIPDSIKSGTKRRQDTPYPKDVDPWNDAKRRRLTFGEELPTLDEDSETEKEEENGTPKVKENVIALDQEDDTVCLASIGEEVEETAVMNVDDEKYAEKLSKGENSKEVEDQEDEEESEVRITRKKPVDERHENLWTASFSFSEFNDSLFPDSVELEKNDSF